MGPEIGSGEKSKAEMEASTYKVNGALDEELEEALMKFTYNYEGNKVGTHLVDQTEKAHINADVEVNIMECTNSGTTESSSSFDDHDYGVVDTLGESEALSDFHGDAGSPLDLYELDELFRIMKKKLRSHWRSFVRPLKWRCKWVELQIKKFEAQAQKYDRELDIYSQQKQVWFTESTLEGVGVKSLPFSQNYVESKVLKRKKRRRAEATEDVSSYMSHHNLFAYYESRKYIIWGTFMDDELRNREKANHKADIYDEWGNDQLLSVENGNGDDSLEHIFRKIEFLWSRVGKLKSRVEKVASENVGNLHSTNRLSSPNYGNRMSIGNYIASQLISEYNMGAVHQPENAVTNGSTDRFYFADAFQNEDEEDVLIDNLKAMEEMCNFEEMKER